MPYIKQEQRTRLDDKINALGDEILRMTEAYDWPSFAGLLNYSITKLSLRVVTLFPKNYALIALVSGVFANVQSEFYRRYATPYEGDKIDQNGDVF